MQGQVSARPQAWLFVWQHKAIRKEDGSAFYDFINLLAARSG